MEPNRRALIVICDGLGDRPSQQNGNRTPLEVASQDTLARLAREGSLGLVDPVAPGVRPGSDVATMSLLGYDPYKYYEGRGSLEALGSGFSLKSGDAAFRCNFSTVDKKLVVVDRRAGRNNDGIKELAASISTIRLPGIKIEFKATVSHRAVLIFRGKKLSRQVADADPHESGKPVSESTALDDSPAAKRTASLVNKFVGESYRVLNEHPANLDRVKRGIPPANIVLPRGAGTLPKVKTLTETYGVRAACVGAVPLVRGVCRLAGMQLIDVPTATGGPDTDYIGKAKAAVNALRQNDFVVLHYKAPDVLGHDGDFEGKRRAIERIDSALGSAVEEIKRTELDCIIAVTGDHSTPVDIREHTADPVPLLIHGAGISSSEVERFDERHAARGNFGRIRGLSLTPILMDLTGFSKQFGF